MPMPTLLPLDTLSPPARAASLLLSVASMVTLPPVMFLPFAFTADSAPDTTTLIAPPIDMSESLPATLPASACAASLPRNTPSMFWVRFDFRVTSPSSCAMMSPEATTFALLLFTDTATPKAMELAFWASDMAAPVPIVLKLPVFSAVAEMSLFAMMLPTFTLASWLATVTPTAAATWIFFLSPLPPTLFRSVPAPSLICFRPSSVPSALSEPFSAVTFWLRRALVDRLRFLLLSLPPSAFFFLSSRSLILSAVLLSLFFPSPSSLSLSNSLPSSRSLLFSSNFSAFSPTLLRFRAMSAPMAVARARVTSSLWLSALICAAPATVRSFAASAFTAEEAMFTAAAAPTAVALPTA